MAELKHELNILASIAKADKALGEFHSELERIPGKIAKIDKAQERLEKSRASTISRFEAMQKERRELDQKLQDNEEALTRSKQQLMEVKTNKEYKAMLKEIETIESDIDTKEVRVLELMEELDTRGHEHEAELQKFAQDEEKNAAEKKSFEARASFLEAEIAKLEAEKAGHLKDIAPDIRKKYLRLMENLGGLPAARIEGVNCGGCGSKVPPQLIHEVKQNDQLITCETCGRILIYYTD